MTLGQIQSSEVIFPSPARASGLETAVGEEEEDDGGGVGRMQDTETMEAKSAKCLHSLTLQVMMKKTAWTYIKSLQYLV